MPLAPAHLLAGVVTAGTRERSDFDTLTIETARGGVLMAPGLPPHGGAQRVVDALPGAIVAPLPEGMIDRLPARALAGQQALWRAAYHEVQHGVDESVHIGRPWSATQLCGQEQGGEIRLVEVGLIGGIALVVHLLRRTSPPLVRERH